MDDWRRTDGLDVLHTVAFTVMVGAIAELGEQSRFRTVIDPIVTMMFLALVIPVVQKFDRREVRK